jgi:hypothetical protein
VFLNLKDNPFPEVKRFVLRQRSGQDIRAVETKSSPGDADTAVVLESPNVRVHIDPFSLLPLRQIPEAYLQLDAPLTPPDADYVTLQQKMNTAMKTLHTI